MRNRIFLVIASVFSLIAASFLSLESYLKIYGKSLCSTAACEIVSRYLSISETVLITFGAGFFFNMGDSLYAHSYHAQLSTQQLRQKRIAQGCECTGLVEVCVDAVEHRLNGTREGGGDGRRRQCDFKGAEVAPVRTRHFSSV